MARTIKKYQLLLDFQLSTYFLVNGSPIFVTFKHGIRKPFLVRGRFATDDPALQEAIEADAGFNKRFYLEKTDVMLAPGEVVEPEQVDEIKPNLPVEENTPPSADEVPPTGYNVPNTLEDKPADEVPPEAGQVPDNVSATNPDETPATAPDENQGENTDAPVVPQDVQVFADVETVTAAKQILLEKFSDLKPSMLPNRVKVLEVAKEKNISFPKLEL